MKKILRNFQHKGKMRIHRKIHLTARDIYENENGSVSLLIIGLFITTIAAIMVVTDISVIASAKRSLDHATEAAVQRATHTLDEKAYYSGKFNRFTQMYRLVNPNYYVENRIPIDCAAGIQNAKIELQSWRDNGGYMKRIEIMDYRIDNLACDFDTFSLSTSASIKLPFNVPFSSISKATVISNISARNEKNLAFYLFGIRIR